MLRIAGFIIIILILIFVIKHIRLKVIPILKAIVKVAAIIFIVYCAINYTKLFFIFLGSLIAVFVILLIMGTGTYKKKYKQFSKVYEQKAITFTSSEVNQIIYDIVDRFPLKVDSYYQRYNKENMPYGRANAYLNLFGSSIHVEEPLSFFVYKSQDVYELREYGILVTNKGIYIATEAIDSMRKNKRKKRANITILFSGLHEVVHTQNDIQIRNLIRDKRISDFKSINKRETFIDLSTLKAFLQAIIDSEISFAYCFGTVIDDADTSETGDDIFKKVMSGDTISNVVEMAGVASSLNPIKQQFDEMGNYMNAAQGGGYAAEYGNNTMDKLLGKNVINEAQNLDQETGRQVKNGADRIVNSISMQTKYYQTARDSINAAFSNGSFKYYNEDGSPMMIEVPRDQYHEAVKLMQQKIDKGEIKNVKPKTDARKLVRKGYFSYYEANNIAIAGTVESITVDVINGCVTCASTMGISAVMAFALALWQGASPSEAARLSMKTAISVMGKSIGVYVITMQLTRSNLINPFSPINTTQKGVKASVSTIKNPFFVMGEKVSNTISKSSLGQSEIGRFLGIDKMSSKMVIAGGVIAIVSFGPDVVRTVSGKISSQQLFKNSAVTAASLSGAAVGQVLIPIPIVGGIIGGAASGFVAKNLLDDFIEDDMLKMFRILKEAFIDCTMSCNLSQEEFNHVIDETIGSENLLGLLKQMFQSGDYSSFARNAILQPAIINAIAKREKILLDNIDKGILELVEIGA